MMATFSFIVVGSRLDRAHAHEVSLEAFPKTCEPDHRCGVCSGSDYPYLDDVCKIVVSEFCGRGAYARETRLRSTRVVVADNLADVCECGYCQK
jgi:hypothetical protein